MTHRSIVRVVAVLLAPCLMAADPAPPGPGGAGGGLTYTPPAPPGPPDVAGLVVRLFGLTAGTIAVCGGILWAVRRMNRLQAPNVGPADRLRHDGSLAIDRRCTVHLIHADGHAVAATTDASGLRSLVLLSDPFEKVLNEAEQ